MYPRDCRYSASPFWHKRAALTLRSVILLSRHREKSGKAEKLWIDSTKDKVLSDSIDFAKDVRITTLISLPRHCPDASIPNHTDPVCPTAHGTSVPSNPKRTSRSSSLHGQKSPGLLHTTKALQPRTLRRRLLRRPICHSGGIWSGILTPLRCQRSDALIPRLGARFIRPRGSQQVVPEDGVGREIVLQNLVRPGTRSLGEIEKRKKKNDVGWFVG